MRAKITHALLDHLFFTDLFSVTLIKEFGIKILIEDFVALKGQFKKCYSEELYL